MAHGTPLGIGDNDKKYGAKGAFLIEAGISSSYHIANFFGLTEWIRQPRETSKQVSKVASKEASKEPSKQAAKVVPVVPPGPAQVPDIGTVLWPLTTLNR